MGSLSFFDPTRVVLEFLAIQAEHMGQKKLEIEFRRPSGSESPLCKMRIARLKVDNAAQKAFYAVEADEELKEFSLQMLQSVGGVRLV